MARRDSSHHILFRLDSNPISQSNTTPHSLDPQFNSNAASMNIADLITSINATASSDAKVGEKEQSQLLAATSKLLFKLETPREQVFRILFAVRINFSISLIPSFGF
jgi:hypothetical protein